MPVLPTSQSTSASTVVFSSAANLNAIAPRGELDRVPAAAKAPAVGEPQHRAVEVVVELVALGLDVGDGLLRRPASSQWRMSAAVNPMACSALLQVGAGSVSAARSKAKNCSRRPATVVGSFARSVPAAALRGLISGLSGCAAL